MSELADLIAENNELRNELALTRKKAERAVENANRVIRAVAILGAVVIFLTISSYVWIVSHR